ncbi:MAG: multidrug effflux MFS transporter [Alphaproteobacteria bacterium]|nr:multidrug effflux MFS transporter [Alphaproteobacteria bacterium]
MITLVSAVIALGQFSTSIYMPSLPAMTLDLGTTGTAMQLTLTVYLAGFALSQLALGPLSDRVGRRPVLLGGLAVYVAAGIACALARDVGELIAARLVQSVGACAGAVVGRAIVRDLYDRGEAARVMASAWCWPSHRRWRRPSAPTSMSGLAGRVWFSWQANFLLVAGFGVAVGLGPCAYSLRPVRAGQRRPAYAQV